MTAYYNEIDPYAAQWLRNLITAKLIAPGEVDQRSIEHVQPADLVGFTQCHFFAGIGVWSHALRQAQWADDREVWTGSCPCQPFSAAGRQSGLNDSRHLWPHLARLIGERKPRTFFGEQVASADGLAWLDFVCADLEAAGYAIGAIDTCAASVGAPHIRQRLFFVADAQARGFGIDGCAQRETGHSPQRHTNGIAVGDAQQPGLERQRRHGDQGNQPGRDGTQQNGPAGQAGQPGRMAESSSERCQWDPGTRRQAQCGFEHPGDENRMANPDGGNAGGMEHTPEIGREVALLEHRGSAPAQTERQADERRGRGAVNGFWADAEWIPCADGKARAIESGTFPLAYGAPARVGRLRAYGNAIVAPVAIEFIKAFMEARP